MGQNPADWNAALETFPSSAPTGDNFCTQKHAALGGLIQSTMSTASCTALISFVCS